VALWTGGGLSCCYLSNDSNFKEYFSAEFFRVIEENIMTVKTKNLQDKPLNTPLSQIFFDNLFHRERNCLNDCFLP
jgi:hypothetical protein